MSADAGPPADATPGTATPVFTIGHSTHPAERFVALLTRHRIDAVADVRAAPYSRRNPQFDREALAGTLDAAGIGYVFLGRELGGRLAPAGSGAEAAADGASAYRRRAAAPDFRAGLDRVARGTAKGLRVALMCAEREPLDCHRMLLVGRELAARGHPLFHILADGRAEAHAATEARLLALAGPATGDLFGADDLDRAYRRREATLGRPAPRGAR